MMQSVLQQLFLLRLFMRYPVGKRYIELTQGDITLQSVDAIVNAANSRLAGGGGVDGAIHRRGGPTIMAETGERYPEGCPTGSAVITGGGNLSAKFVIHAVGPVWRGGQSGEPELLASAYRHSLELAAEHACRTIAMPALSTGAYGYPMDLACRIAIVEARTHLEGETPLEMVRFALFSEGAVAAFTVALQEVQ
jgi:O-acetyl-ADP-ribose deacetylase (regulator of RNase III)